MFVSTHGITARPTSNAYGTLTTAWITATGETDTTILGALNTLESDLTTYGLTSKIKALYPFVGGTATKHKYNFMDAQDTDAAFRLVFSGGWTHSSTGALPNGTNAYADTKLTPSVALSSKNSTHISAYSRTNVSQDSFIIGSGANTGSKDLQIVPRWSDNNSYFRVNSTNDSGVSTGSDSRGLFIANRISSTETRNYRNSTRYVLSTSSNTFADVALFLSATNNAGNAASYSSREIALSSIGDGLTDTEASNFYTAVQAFQTTLSRNI